MRTRYYTKLTNENEVYNKLTNENEVFTLFTLSFSEASIYQKQKIIITEK